jgi:hypothetical protein
MGTGGTTVITSVHDPPRCGHGERADRRTSEDEPICALCRILERRFDQITPPPIDYAALAAGEDTP